MKVEVTEPAPIVASASQRSRIVSTVYRIVIMICLALNAFIIGLRVGFYHYVPWPNVAAFIFLAGT
jgi:hypothetical protein